EHRTCGFDKQRQPRARRSCQQLGGFKLHRFVIEGRPVCQLWLKDGTVKGIASYLTSERLLFNEHKYCSNRKREPEIRLTNLVKSIGVNELRQLGVPAPTVRKRQFLSGRDHQPMVVRKVPGNARDLGRNRFILQETGGGRPEIK